MERTHTVAVTMGIPNGWNIHNESVRMHRLNAKWWHDLKTGERLDLDKGERLMLVVTELAEAAEAHRKSLKDDHLPQYDGEIVECCDALIRLFDLRAGYGYFQAYRPSRAALHATGRGNVLGALMEIVSKVEAIHFLMIEPIPDHDVIAMAIDQAIEHIFNFIWWRGYGDICREVYEAKVAYNQTRIDHTVEHRLGEHGKKV